MQTPTHATTISPTSRRVVGFLGALLAAGAVAGTSVSDASPEPVAPATGTEIACGGYTAQGELLRPLAATTTSAHVDADGRLVVPATCGGYTEDGQFIGDD